MLRLAAAAALLILLVWLGRVGARSAAAEKPDFEYFYEAGRSLLLHGSADPGYERLVDGRVVARGKLDWYLPFVSRAMTLLAWLPQRPAAYVWLAINLAALLATIRLVGRHLSGLPPEDWAVTQLLPFLLVLPFWYWEFRLNQVNTLTLLLLVGGFTCWQRGRPWLAGLWLGVAILLKVTPALLLVWFGLKRQGRVVAAAIATVLLAGFVPDALLSGSWRDAARSWFDRTLARGGYRTLILEQREMDWRNQSLTAVASRWLHPTDYATRFDNEPRVPYTGPAQFINVADLPRPLVAALVTSISAASLIGLLWLARRPVRDYGHCPPANWPEQRGASAPCSAERADAAAPSYATADIHASSARLPGPSRSSLDRLRVEWVLFVLAMLWFMPVVRSYHLIWAYPALAVLGGPAGMPARCPRTGALLWLMLLVVLEVLAFIPNPPEWAWTWPHAAGVLLAVVLAIMLALMRVHSRESAQWSAHRETRGCEAGI